MPLPVSMLRELNADIDGDSQKIQDFFVEMLRIKSVNPKMGGPGEQQRAQFLEDFLRSEGFQVSRIDVRDDESRMNRPNLSSRLEGSDPSRTLWYVSHMDTVPEGSLGLWKTKPFEPTVKDGKIIARGAEDNGQSLVASLFALRELKKMGAPLPFNVGVWFVADEEFGSTYGIKRLLSGDHFKKDDLVVVPDAGTPRGTDIETSEKGLLWFKVTVHGKQVHGSLPHKGLNAHRVGMKLALDLDKSLNGKYRARDNLFDEPSSTFEPTKKDPNVPNINTIPGIDVFYFDCRVLPRYSLADVISDVKMKIARYEEKYGVKAEMVEEEKDIAGPATPPDSEVVVLLAEAIKRVSRVKPRITGIGGQTVGNLFRNKGIPTAVWSTVDDMPHEPNEYSKVKNLLNDAKVFAALPLLA